MADQQHRESGEERLTDEEIAAILEAEGATPPEAGHAPPPHAMVQKHPGEGQFGKWFVWAFIAFILFSAYKAYF